MLHGMISGRSIALGIAAASFFPTALAAAPLEIGAKTRLQHCGADTCLLITGHRSDANAPVLLAGHDVAVQGKRRWRVALPLDTVRNWVAPFARSIAVQVDGAGGAEAKARLPIGLLGHDMDLAFLDVSAHH